MKKFLAFLVILGLFSIPALASPFKVHRKTDTCDQGFQAFQNTLFPFIRTNCAKCHGGNGPGPGHSVSDPGVSYARISQYVDWDDLPNCVLVKTGGNGHCHGCGVTEQNLLDQLHAWWDGGEKTCPRVGKFVSDPQNLPDNLPTDNDTYVPMRWALDSLGDDYTGSFFEIQVQKFADPTDSTRGAYRFTRPRLATPDSPMHVSGLKVLINGKYDSLSNIYTSVDVTIAPQSIPTDATAPYPHPVLSSRHMIVLQDKMQGDQVMLAFDDISVAKAAPSCKAPDVFESSIYSVMQARNCFACHGGGPYQLPGSGLAAIQFNLAGSSSDVCTKAVQRIDRNIPEISPLLDYPLRGANTHSVILTDPSEVLPSWINWIKKETQ